MDYYHIAHQASSQIGDHEGLIYLQNQCRTAKKILDVGCGEGTRLNTLLPKNKRGWGIDPSPKAISRAKKQYPRYYFRLGVGESLPYPDYNFDLVYSAFTIEHCSDPEIFLREMVRVCHPGGRIVILAPNYGAPNRRSPNSKENPFNKFFEGLLMDIFPPPSLSWRQVTPQTKYTQIDADTTWEPYLYSLSRYLKSLSLSLEKSSSLWELEPQADSPRKQVIKWLGSRKIFPFLYWGPQVFVVAVK